MRIGKVGVALRRLDQRITEQFSDGHHIHAVHRGDGVNRRLSVVHSPTEACQTYRGMTRRSSRRSARFAACPRRSLVVGSSPRTRRAGGYIAWRTVPAPRGRARDPVRSGRGSAARWPPGEPGSRRGPVGPERRRKVGRWRLCRRGGRGERARGRRSCLRARPAGSPRQVRRRGTEGRGSRAPVRIV